MRSLFLLLAACAGTPDEKPPLGSVDQGCLVVSPASVDFGVVARGSRALETLTLTNDCDGPAAELTVADVTVAGGRVALDGAAWTTLSDGETLALTLTLDAIDVGPVTDELHVTLADDSVHTVPISATVAGPVLDVASPADFGAVEVGCAGTTTLALRNAGDEPLIVELALGDPTVTTASTWPVTLAAAEELSVELNWAPAVAGSLSTVARVVTNDALAPDVEVALTGTATEESWRTESFPGVRPTDILVTIDQSMSGTRVDEVRAALPAFLAALEGYDYRLAGVGTDDGCIGGSALYSTRDDAPEVAEERLSVQANMLAQLGYTQLCESPFTTLAAAIEQDVPGGCNEGLLREDASLVTISISDEDEQSDGTDAAALALVPRVVDDPSTLRMHAIAGPYPGGCGGFGEGARFYLAATGTGGTLLPICDPIETSLLTLAEASFWFEPLLELTEPPAEGTLTVTIDGVPSTAWELDVSVLTLLEEPAPSSTIEVRYQVVGACDGG